MLVTCAFTAFNTSLTYTNSSGIASFTTIYPGKERIHAYIHFLSVTHNSFSLCLTMYDAGWYARRTIHIHVRVRTYDSTGNTTLYEDTTQLFFNDTISDEVTTNVYPYNDRTSMRDTYNTGDSLFTTSNVISLSGYYTYGYTSSMIELNIPFSGRRHHSSYSGTSIRRIVDDDDDGFGQNLTSQIIAS